MEELRRLWEKFEKNVPYPEEGHIEDFDLGLYDTNIAGAVIEYLKKGHPERTSLPVIEQNVAALRQALPTLPASIQDYFKELLALGEHYLSLQK